VMTQIAYDLDALVAWAGLVDDRGISDRAALIVGVAPLHSAAHARALERLPGVTVPPELIAAVEEAGREAEAVGAAQCVEMVTRLRETPGIAGVHVMGMGQEGVVRRVIEESGLLPRPTPPTA